MGRYASKPSPLPTSYEVTSPPSFQLETPAGIRRQLRLPDFPGEAVDASEDDYLTSLIKVAGDSVETQIARPVRAQTRVYTLDRARIEESRTYGAHSGVYWWQSDAPIILNVAPVRAVSAVKWRDSDGVQQTVDAADYRVDGLDAGTRRTVDIYPLNNKHWPWFSYAYNDTPDISLELECGWATVEAVPEGLIHACRLLCAHFYNNRAVVAAASLSKVPMSVQYLLNQYQRIIPV